MRDFSETHPLSQEIEQEEEYVQAVSGFLPDRDLGVQGRIRVSCQDHNKTNAINVKEIRFNDTVATWFTSKETDFNITAVKI